MRRAFPRVVIPFAAALGLAAAARADLPEAKSAGVLRVIVAADEAPETFVLEAGEHPGFEREMLESFARLHGLRLEVVTAKAYGDRIPMLVAAQGDVIAAIFDTPDRRRQVAFTAEVMPSRRSRPSAPSKTCVRPRWR